MPLYEFKCAECENVFEKLQSRSAAPPSVCPSCGKEGSISKLISNTSFHLKGGGWYADGYGSGGGSDAKAASSGEPSSSSSDSSSSTSTTEAASTSSGSESSGDSTSSSASSSDSAAS